MAKLKDCKRFMVMVETPCPWMKSEIGETLDEFFGYDKASRPTFQYKQQHNSRERCLSVAQSIIDLAEEHDFEIVVSEGVHPFRLQTWLVRIYLLDNLITPRLTEQLKKFDIRPKYYA